VRGGETSVRPTRRRLSPAAGWGTSALAAALLLVALAFLVLEPWHGSTVVSLSEEHGIDVADLPAVVLIAVAIVMFRRSAGTARRESRGRVVGACAIALGALLLAGLAVPRIGAPLVPTGGGTFDRSTTQLSGSRPEPVGRWTHLAVTYDGTAARFYVNGVQVTSRSLSGKIRQTTDPLWIGGNRPYGEYFQGVIDDARVYDRALTAGELRTEMNTPLERHEPAAADLVAAYSFDADRGAVAADVSGRGNAGTIFGARWTNAGRFGGGMSFDGRSEIVRVPASASLDLERAMTLAAWVKPTKPQSGWRTVLARQTDAYTLMAGGGRQDARRLEARDHLRFALVFVLLAFIGWAVAHGHSLWAAGRRHWYWPLALFVVGSLVDVALAPSDTLVGPALVALWWGATSGDRAERLSMYALAAAFAAVTALAVGDPT
jgi:hypothetical protein